MDSEDVEHLRLKDSGIAFGDSAASPDDNHEVFYARRRRAMSETAPFSEANSEIVSENLDEDKGRLVAVWAAFKRSWDAKRRDGDNDSLAPAPPSPRTSRFGQPSASADGSLTPVLTLNGLFEDGENEYRDDENKESGGADRDMLGSYTDLPLCYPPQPRKVVSLLLRRKKRPPPARDGATSPGKSSLRRPQKHLSPAERSQGQQQFRRVQSQLEPPVSGLTSGGEGAKYLKYAGELDDASFERLRDFTRHMARTSDANSHAHTVPMRRTGENAEEGSAVGGNSGGKDGSTGDDGDRRQRANRGADEIIGEICLEDFADASSEDFDFLDDVAADGAMSPRQSGRGMKVDSETMTWIGNEAEFNAFFADVGLDDFMLSGGDSSPKASCAVFKVEPEVLAEWEEAVADHNKSCRERVDTFVASSVDIRTLVDEFCRRRRR
jgi:hypothetical protein